MRSFANILLSASAAIVAYAADHGCTPETLPELSVPTCDSGNRAVATINKRLGTLEADFPEATVKLCYNEDSIEMGFYAMNETSYYVNDTLKNNDPIWRYTVMEAFIALGDHDPTHYFEFEVAPNGKIWTGYIHNPTKDFSSKATAFVTDWDTYPIFSETERKPWEKTWSSGLLLPLSMFNVEKPEGTQWRMNFFRTYFQNKTAPQEYGAWNPNKLISFHQTPCFGRVTFTGQRASSPVAVAEVEETAKAEASAAAVAHHESKSGKTEKPTYEKSGKSGKSSHRK